ncbi:hypothetical protein [Bdellovibrio sp. BCCA]|uniref:hypothetical protein n=1 Tax=Bdellovibrio sp. BCCA TaxID=3136281 RepID=UPI0030F13A8F
MNKQIIFSTFAGILIGFIIGKVTDRPTPLNNIESAPPSIQKQESAPEKIVYKECPTDPTDSILPAPSLSANLATPLLSNHEGEVRVAWNAVPHATRYRLQVLDPVGKVVKTYTTPRTTIYLKELAYNESLPFTPYSVVLSTINRKNEEGAISPRYEVRIRPLKNLTAPSINEITIENE